MKDLVEFIVKSLVENPDNVEISLNEEKDSDIILVVVDKEDMGKVIGKNGKIAQSIRTIIKSVSGKNERSKVVLKIEERV